MKSLWVHAGVLALACALGLSVWSGDGSESAEAGASSGSKVEVWGGSADAIESIRFESAKLAVSLEPKKDGEGRYYVAKLDKEEGGPHDASAVDAGAPAPGKRTSLRFIGVKTAEELAKQLAPLMALRKVGQVEPKRAEEFGLDKPDGTLKVKIGGAEHGLVFGGTTPGGQERYAKELGTNVVYAVAGELLSNLAAAESRLLERDLHAFPSLDVTRVRVSKGAKSREIVALPEKKGGWADPATPTKLDETAGNWMSKLDRLHVQAYVEAPKTPLRREDAAVRIEYFAGSKPLGFLELYKVPGEKGSDYLVKTERTRWAAQVLTSAAEQVDQDLGSVLK
jgi:hypothetical protein